MALIGTAILTAYVSTGGAPPGLLLFVHWILVWIHQHTQDVYGLWFSRPLNGSMFTGFPPSLDLWRSAVSVALWSTRWRTGPIDGTDCSVG